MTKTYPEFKKGRKTLFAVVLPEEISNIGSPIPQPGIDLVLIAVSHSRLVERLNAVSTDL